MRALWCEGPGQLAWRDRPEPTLIEPSDVLVRPLAVARCDLDVAIAVGLYPMPLPMAMGHEVVGEVVAVGGAVESWSRGDRVIVPFQISCGTCPMCRRGLTNACQQVPPGAAFGLGVRNGIDYGGGLADLMRVPYADQMLLALPDDMSPVAAAGIPDNVADGFRTVAEPLRQFPGGPVLVVGGLAQSVGLYAVAAALALGSERVRYVDHDAGRLAAAVALGADVEERPLDTLGDIRESFPITVDACVIDAGRDFALRSTLPCGHCTSVSGGAGPRADLPLQSMYLKGITYHIGRVHARATAPSVLELVQRGVFDPLAVAHRVVEFDAAAEELLAPDIKLIFARDT